VIRNVLIDAGPIVAMLNPRDRWHDWVRAQLAQIHPPLLTCDSVISEACFLAQRSPPGMEGVLGLVDRGVMSVEFSLKDNFREVSSMMRHYVDVPMSVADACFVRMSELVERCIVLTLDSDFRIYRRHKNQKIPLLIPSEL
jgi:uncharacterized protein